MFVIGEAIIEDEVASERFACDLDQCKGACCTLRGARGAPLDDAELVELERVFPAARKYLPEEHLQVIEEVGLFEGTPGNYSTPCVGEGDCAFVFYEGDIARCSLEKAYRNGETTWRKPFSCRLFPIRIAAGAFDRLWYEKIPECAAGRIHGSSRNVRLSEFVKDALISRYGSVWYDEFQKECFLREDRNGR